MRIVSADAKLPESSQRISSGAKIAEKKHNEYPLPALRNWPALHRAQRAVPLQKMGYRRAA